jgi:hypothetical protein
LIIGKCKNDGEDAEGVIERVSKLDCSGQDRVQYAQG